MNQKRRNQRRILRLEALDQRRCLAADVALSYSAADLDVNHDGQVSPLDALAVINALIRAAELRGAAEGEGDSGTLDTDVNNDGATSPGDAVIVINDLNQDTADTASATEDTTTSETPDPSDSLPPTDDTGIPAPSTSDDSTSDDSTSDDSTSDDSTSDDSTSDDSTSDDSTGDDSTGDEECGRPRRIETVFANHDTNEDGELTADEVPAEVWTRLSAADSDANGGVSLEEILAAVADMRPEGHGGPGHGGPGRPGHERPGEGAGDGRPGHGGPRATLFAEFDANEDGLLTADEVSEQMWERISQADSDESGSVSAEEWMAFRPTPPSPLDRIFARLDANDDGVLMADEVPEGIWERLSSADADGDGSITKEELSSLAPEAPPHREPASESAAANSATSPTAGTPLNAAPMRAAPTHGAPMNGAAMRGMRPVGRR